MTSVFIILLLAMAGFFFAGMPAMATLMAVIVLMIAIVYGGSA